MCIPKVTGKGGPGKQWSEVGSVAGRTHSGIPATGFPHRGSFAPHPLRSVEMHAQSILTELPVRDNKYIGPSACLFTFSHDPLWAGQPLCVWEYQ